MVSFRVFFLSGKYGTHIYAPLLLAQRDLSLCTIFLSQGLHIPKGCPKQ
jgi:hypothetical protein